MTSSVDTSIATIASKKPSVVRAAFSVGVFTFFSRIVGYIRECIMAAYLGAGMYSDSLLVALRIANTFRRIFAEGAFNASFLPRFSHVFNREGEKEANILLAHVFSFLLLTLFAFSGVIIWYFPSVLRVLVSGFEEGSKQFELTVTLGRICFPYLILISLCSLFSGVLNTVNSFALPAAMYSLLSIFTGGSLLLCHYMDASKSLSVHVMSYSVVISGIVHSWILYWALRKYGFSVKVVLNFWTPKVRDIMANMIPGIIGAGVWQLNLLVDTAVSSYLPIGTITCINLADRLNQFPLGTLGIAIGTALLPILSKHLATQNYQQASRELERSLLFAFFFTFFAFTLMLSASNLIVTVAFQRGYFGEEHVRITSVILRGLLVGLPAYVLSKIYSAVYFAAKDTRTPVWFAAISVAVNIMFVVLLMPFFLYLGLAISAAFSASINALLLIVFSKRHLRLQISRKFWVRLGAQIIASCITYYVCDFVIDFIWDTSFSLSSIKWAIFFSVFCVATFSYSVGTVIFLKLGGCDNWKIWRRSAWT